MNHIINLFIAFIVFLMLSSALIKFTSLPPWAGGLFLIAIGIFLYFTNIFLVKRYVQKRAPDFANNKMWEMTAGTGIVPKWVSFIGLLALPALVAAVVWLAVWYWPT